MNLKRKSLIVTIVLFAMILIGTRNVKAVELADCYGIVTEGEITEETLNSIANNFTVDYKEVDYEKAIETIYNQVKEELNKKGIVISNFMDYNSYQNDEENKKDIIRMYIDLPDVKKGVISLNDVNLKKEFTVQYNNSSEYNDTDKNYVENLFENLNVPRGERGSFIVTNYIDFGTDIYPDTIFPNGLKLFENKINDKDIVVKKNGLGMGGGSIFSGFHSHGINIFYKGIYYKNIGLEINYQAQIIVPNSIESTDTAFINYALPVIKEYMKKSDSGYDTSSLKLEKENNYYYKATYNYTYDGVVTNKTETLIIRKDDGIFVNNNGDLNSSIYVNNLENGLTITVTPKSNNYMINDVKSKGYNNILGSYEFTLTGADKLSQPIDITFYVGDEYNGKIIYVLHQKHDESYEEFEKEVVNGKITITVKELSPFVLGVKESSPEKDDTPKTGTINYIYYLIPVTLISLFGAIILKRKEQN